MAPHRSYSSEDAREGATTHIGQSRKKRKLDHGPACLSGIDGGVDDMLGEQPRSSSPSSLVDPSDSAAHKVLFNSYLLEMTLLALHGQTTNNWQEAEDESGQTMKKLLDVQRVCRTFQGTIRDSAPLQRLLFLQPSASNEWRCVCGGGPLSYIKFLVSQDMCSTWINPIFYDLISEREFHSRCKRWHSSRLDHLGPTHGWDFLDLIRRNLDDWGFVYPDDMNAEGHGDLEKDEGYRTIPTSLDMSLSRALHVELPENQQEEQPEDERQEGQWEEGEQVEQEEDQVEQEEAEHQEHDADVFEGYWENEPDELSDDETEFPPDPDENYEVPELNERLEPTDYFCIPILSFDVESGDQFHSFGKKSLQAAFRHSWWDMRLTKPSLCKLQITDIESGTWLFASQSKDGFTMGWLWSKLNSYLESHDGHRRLRVDMFDWAE